jgi:hypothetical protein
MNRTGGEQIFMKAISRTDVLERVRAEYLEMPGMWLTVQQVQRLCGVERTTCQWALDSLVAAKFLCVKSDGSYARSTDGEFPWPHSVKADIAHRRIATAS